MRPTDLRLRHVRIPPGFGSSVFSSTPLTVYDALACHGK